MTIADLIAFLACFPPETEVSVHHLIDGEASLAISHDWTTYSIFNTNHEAVFVWPRGHASITVPLADFPTWYVANATKLVGNNG